MTVDARSAAAVVLAGGNSRRFGSDKGGARWCNRSLLEHVIARLPVDRAETIVVLRAEQELDLRPEWTIIHDDPSLPAGPLRAVVQGLAACHSDWAWVVACDQPLLDTRLLAALSESAGGEHAVIPCWQDHLQPLTGLYATTCGTNLLGCLESGERSLIGALETIGFKIFTEAQCRLIDPAGVGFLNINHPEQMAELERLAAASDDGRKDLEVD